jgi:hypothetical protein
MLGLGSSSCPCIVNTCVQLQAINEGTSFYYQLGNDTGCSSTSSWNASAGFVPLTGCAGLDGAGRVIDRLSINLLQVWNGPSGLFSAMSNSISSVGLTRADITATGSVSALAGTFEGAITSSDATGTVAGVANVGGLVGETQGSVISVSFATGAVSGQAMGGLVGCETPSFAISTSYWVAGSANGATDCYYVFVGGGHGHSHSYYGNTGCTEVTPAEGVSYFYDVTNAPMSTWSFDASHWSAFCNGSGFPPLAWQNVSDPSQCVVGAP